MYRAFALSCFQVHVGILCHEFIHHIRSFLLRTLKVFTMYLK